MAGIETDKERLKILDMIASGQISVEDGIRLLSSLPDGEELDLSLAEPSAVPTPEPLSPPEPEDNPIQPAYEEISAEIPAKPEVEPVPVAYRGEAEPGETGAPQMDPAEGQAKSFETEPEVLPQAARFEPGKFQQFWLIPLWVGIGIMLVGAFLMYWAWSASGFGFWFACTWFPFMLGVGVMALAWSSRTARWLHVRVHQKPGEKPEKIAISLPIPLRLTAWALRTFGDRIPNMQGTSLDEVIMALDATSPEAPFYVEVNEGDDGERVEVYIG